MSHPFGRKPGRRRAACWAAMALAVLPLQGCGLHCYRARVRCPPIDPSLSPIERALAYLDETQVKTVIRPRAGGADFPGNWPQYVLIHYPLRIRARDVSPFLPACIHHSLSLIHEDTQAALGLTRHSVERTRSLRRAAAEFMQRFETPADSDLAGAYGFWLRKDETLSWQKPWLGRLRGDWLAAPFFWLFINGPAWEGPLAPLNVPQMPTSYGIHPDADDTAIIYSALLNAHRLDGGPAPNPPFHLFAQWRHTGQVDIPEPPDWLPASSGAFLTWFGSRRNDVDLVVNANVLYMLARFGRLDAEGAAEAQAVILEAVTGYLEGAYRDSIELYYPNPVMAGHAVARAFREGPVPGLEPAAKRLADDLRRRARFRKDGAVFWNVESPDLDTALSILVLLNTGQHLELVPGAVQFLLQRQHPRRGHWPEGYSGGGRSGRGRRINWVSAPFSTALCLEALCRFVLEAEGHEDPRWREVADQVRRRVPERRIPP